MQENCYKKNTRNVIYIYGLAKDFFEAATKENLQT